MLRQLQMTCPSVSCNVLHWTDNNSNSSSLQIHLATLTRRCPSVTCLQFIQNQKAAETSNLVIM